MKRMAVLPMGLIRRVWPLLLLISAVPLVVLGRPGNAWVLALLVPVWVFCLRCAPYSPLRAAMLVIALGLLVSLAATPDLSFSYPKVAGLIYGLTLLWALEAVIDGPKAWLAACFGLALAGLGVSGLALLAVEFPVKASFLRAVVERLPGAVVRLPGAAAGVHPNEVAGVLLWTLPLAPAFAARLWLEAGNRWWKVGAVVLVIIAFGIPLGVLLLAQSRSGYLGLLAAASAALMLVSPPRLRVPLLALLVATLLAGGYLWLRTDLSSQLAEGLEVLGPRLVSSKALAFRFRVWRGAIWAVGDFPLTGLGPNVFRRAFHPLYPDESISSQYDFAHAHNHLLQAALDMGLLGLVGYASLWISLFWVLALAWRRGFLEHPFPRLARIVTLGLCSSLVGYFIYGLTDAVALGARPGFLFWYLVGLVAPLAPGGAAWGRGAVPKDAC